MEAQFIKAQWTHEANRLLQTSIVTSADYLWPHHNGKGLVKTCNDSCFSIGFEAMGYRWLSSILLQRAWMSRLIVIDPAKTQPKQRLILAVMAHEKYQPRLLPLLEAFVPQEAIWQEWQGRHRYILPDIMARHLANSAAAISKLALTHQGQQQIRDSISVLQESPLPGLIVVDGFWRIGMKLRPLLQTPHYIMHPLYQAEWLYEYEY